MFLLRVSQPVTFTNIYYIGLFQLLIVNYFDFKHKTISNLWPVLNVVLFIVFAFLNPSYLSISLTHFYFPLALLVCGFLLFVFKIVGAGDVKYVTSLMLFLNIQDQERFLFALAYVTIFVGIISIVVTIYQNRKEIFSRMFFSYFGKRRNIYAPVIFIAWLMLGLNI